MHVMLPLQYLRQPGDRLAEPENWPALAVLQTVLCDCRGAGLRGATGRDRAWPYSFENLCETIGVDANSLRQRLAQGQVTAA